MNVLLYLAENPGSRVRGKPPEHEDSPDCRSITSFAGLCKSELLVFKFPGKYTCLNFKNSKDHIRYPWENEFKRMVS